DLEPFTVKTPHGQPRALGTKFGLEVTPQLTSCWVENGKVALNADASEVCDAGHMALLDKSGVRRADKLPAREWLQTLQTQAESDHGIGQLIANADHSTEHVALEVKS